jgi:hypothetical protein
VASPFPVANATAAAAGGGEMEVAETSVFGAEMIVEGYLEQQQKEEQELQQEVAAEAVAMGFRDYYMGRREEQERQDLLQHQLQQHLLQQQQQQSLQQQQQKLLQQQLQEHLLQQQQQQQQQFLEQQQQGYLSSTPTTATGAGGGALRCWTSSGSSTYQQFDGFGPKKGPYYYPTLLHRQQHQGEESIYGDAITWSIRASMNPTSTYSSTINSSSCSRKGLTHSAAGSVVGSFGRVSNSGGVPGVIERAHSGVQVCATGSMLRSNSSGQPCAAVLEGLRVRVVTGVQAGGVEV